MIIVRFGSGKLEKAFLRIAVGTNMWDIIIARKYIERINAMQAVNHAAEFTRAFPQYKDHQLKGIKSHLRAFTLHDRWRVEYETDDDGKGVTIRKVSNHYGD